MTVTFFKTTEQHSANNRSRVTWTWTDVTGISSVCTYRKSSLTSSPHLMKLNAWDLQIMKFPKCKTEPPTALNSSTACTTNKRYVLNILHNDPCGLTNSVVARQEVKYRVRSEVVAGVLHTLWQSETWLSGVAVAGWLRPHPVLCGSTPNSEKAEKQWQWKHLADHLWQLLQSFS